MLAFAIARAPVHSCVRYVWRETVSKTLSRMRESMKPGPWNWIENKRRPVGRNLRYFRQPSYPQGTPLTSLGHPQTIGFARGQKVVRTRLVRDPDEPAFLFRV